jgi:prefoldin subunit 5
MKNVLWLIVGVGIGFYAAHRVNQTPQGRAFFEDVDTKAREFGDAVVESYKAREAELRAAVADAEDVIADLTKNSKTNKS